MDLQLFFRYDFILEWGGDNGMKSIFLTVAMAMAMAVTGVAASAQQAEEAPKKEKKICRTEKMTGSLTRRTRICMTEAEWRALNDRTRKGLDEMGQNAAGGTNSAWVPGNGPG